VVAETFRPGGFARLGFGDVHLSRRIVVLIPRSGVPVAITHNIEQGAWRSWPSAWRRERYSSWRALEALLHEIVGDKRVAMEYSAGDAVPYLDRIPAGMLEMVRAAGATVVSSGELVSRFYATWSNDDLLAHRRAAEHIASIAHEAFAHAVSMARAGTPLSEYALQGRIMSAFVSERTNVTRWSSRSASRRCATSRMSIGPRPRRSRGEVENGREAAAAVMAR